MTNPDKTREGTIERLLDNAATCSQSREMLRDDDGTEGVIRECVRLAVCEPMLLALARRDALLREALTVIVPPPNRYPNDLIERIRRELGEK